MRTSARHQPLIDFLDLHSRVFTLTGAGISTGSGIPDYRDEHGAWKRPAPVQYADFVQRLATRQRYWARSLVGWPWFERARPNVCHDTLARWERSGVVGQLVTQNVDRLHQQAGSVRVIDLHGRLDEVVCLSCRKRRPRQRLQQTLAALNPGFVRPNADQAPDGDADIDDADLDGFEVPDCARCGGILKPDVVFFGETVPRQRVDEAVRALLAADALLVIGSSLMVYSGYRFCRLAAEHGIPIAAINPGTTRADALLTIKVRQRFEDLIPHLDGLAATPR